MQKIVEPVFARLGVKHESRNFGNGGLGTLHNAMAAGSIYGPDIDMIMWDSGTCETDVASLINRMGIFALRTNLNIGVVDIVATIAALFLL